MKYIFMIALLCLFTKDMFSQNLFDLKKTSISDIDCYVTNYGLQGHNVANTTGGFIYPRGTQNQYLFGFGLWFGAKKRVNNELRRMLSITYNPNNGRSWMVPGNIEDSVPLPSKDITKYSIERSTDFYADGSNKQSQLPRWSLWKTNGLDSTGTYESNILDRNSTKYPFGIALISDEMFHSRYRDSDLKYYDGGLLERKFQGYPLGLQFDEKIYTWDKEPLKSTVIVQESITNTSNDTLFDCIIANVLDPDIGILSVNPDCTKNDNIRSIKSDNLNGVYAWTNGNYGEKGNNFYYLVVSQLETPAVNNDSLRTIKYSNRSAPTSEQIGTSTIKFYSITDDLYLDYDRYEYINQNVKDTARLDSDIRALLGTGSFTLLPGQSARIAYCISIVQPIKGNEATGSDEDLPAIRNAILECQKRYQSNLMSVNLGQSLYKNLSLSPNPIADQFSLQYNSEAGSEVRISLINLTGAKIADLFSGLANAGENNYNFNLANYGLAAGVYTLQIESGGNITTQKIVIAR